MPETPDTPATPNPSATGNSIPAGSPAETPPSPVADPEYRFGDAPDVPAWARGKTAKEVLEAGKTMYSVLERFNQQGAVPQPQAQQPQYQPPPQYGYQPQQPPTPAEIGDDEFLTGRQVKQLGQQWQQQIAPQFQQSVDLAAQTTYGLVRQKYGKEFDRYGPEIQGYLSNLPKASWSLDNLERVVKIVQAEHLDELVAERARQHAAEAVPSVRPNGGATEGGAPSTGFASTLDPQWVQKAQSVGLDQAAIREFCAANHMTEAQFYKQFDGGLITSAIAESRPRPVVR